MYRRLFLAYFLCSFAYSLSVSEEPCAVVYTPGSILGKKMNFKPWQVGEGFRYATCSSVAWFPGDQSLIAVNLLTSSIQTYSFTEGNLMAQPRKGKQKIKLNQPVQIVFSKKGDLAAVSNSGSGKIGIYGYKSGALNTPALQVLYQQGDILTHGERFSPCSSYFAYLTIDNPGKICLYRMDKKTGEWKLAQLLKNSKFPLKPKGIDFSPDGKYVAICYSRGAANSASIVEGALETYRFDGTIDLTPISSIDQKEGLNTPEDLVFTPDGKAILVSNQASHAITLHEFNPESGEIGESRSFLHNPQAQLSFPHGISFSWEGKHLAVANMGDDKITLYSIDP